eukprot:6924239-Karenia_brevis.AAC.1
MSDAYGKGIVRGQAENTNLRAYTKDNSVTSAEAIRTSQVEAFFGREYVDMVERVNDKKVIEHRAIFAEVDRRNPVKKKITFRDVATLYGQRPRCEEIWYLSPYEFVTYWEPVLLRYPTRERDNQNEAFHATLTDDGVAKVQERRRSANDETAQELIPGIDYVVKE